MITKYNHVTDSYIMKFHFHLIEMLKKQKIEVPTIVYTNLTSKKRKCVETYNPSNCGCNNCTCVDISRRNRGDEKKLTSKEKFKSTNARDINVTSIDYKDAKSFGKDDVKLPNKDVKLFGGDETEIIANGETKLYTREEVGMMINIALEKYNQINRLQMENLLNSMLDNASNKTREYDCDDCSYIS